VDLPAKAWAVAGVRLAHQFQVESGEGVKTGEREVHL
jgi:hypothetical protein